MEAHARDPRKAELQRRSTVRPRAIQLPRPAVAPIFASGAPIRDELLSGEHLEEQATGLAALRTSPSLRKGPVLSPRLRDNGQVLLECYRTIAEVIRQAGEITPAAEWFVDNFHIVDEGLRDVRNDLPEGFYRRLPKLAEGPFAGYPRVFALAWAFVAHTDSRFDPAALRGFVAAFQRVQPLTIGELWAVPITLRMVLLENLRRLAELIVRGRAAGQDADALANELLGVDGHTPDPTAFRRFEGRSLPTTFTVRLVQRLRDQDPETTPALAWLDRRLDAEHTSADEIVRGELQSQGAMHVTVRNAITSLRMMSTFDWADFFEGVSLVDEALRADPTFAEMDFATRDAYRHAIEDLSRGSQRSELEVARDAVGHAARFRGDRRPDTAASDPRAHTGHYLIGDGRRVLEADLGYRPSIGRRLGRAYRSHATASYLGTIAILTALVLAVPLVLSFRSGMGIVWLGAFGLIALVPASDLAMAFANRAVIALIGPRRLPRLALRDGVPADLRTLVVVPTLLTSDVETRAQVHRLEVHYLGNPDGDVRFALLSDWTDAATETRPEDDQLLATARDEIRRLNEEYPTGAPEGDRFLLLHRRRVWNAAQNRWMGWERKRGKLHELNRLLRGAADTTFLTTGGRPPSVPAAVRYVITLDADTRLPRGAACQLVGTMAHPLNRPTLDPRAGRVVEGYAVLQPRVTPTLPTEREGSRFQRIFSGPAGLDPYSAAVSDVYQDLFGEGSYIGKGIYDVDVFEAALAGRVPENALLSHDLFEGLFARAGLVTDIELFEEFPPSYEVAASRQHRWARGDWQLLPWIVRGRSAGTVPTRLPIIARWKMLDNLRRTLSAPATLLTLLAGWTVPGASPLLWTTCALLAMALPVLMPAASDLVRRRPGVSNRTWVRAVVQSLALGGSQLAFHVTFLAHQAWLMTDAIVRTLVRVMLTRRTMLEWVTAARAKARLRFAPSGVYRRMHGAVALAVGAGVLVGGVAPERWRFAAPLIALWLLSPLGARWVSRPARAYPVERLSPPEVRTLRATARRTWRFFEVLVGAVDNHLPPDNLQEDPVPVVAHRTSPTNVGLYLLSTVAARDLGWVGTLDVVDRLEPTLASLLRLERFRGHFLNWYETRDLRPLEPRYVSTVDSGNLAGDLLVLGNACSEMLERPLVGHEALAGIEDALLLTQEAASRLTDDRRTQTVSRTQLDEAIQTLATALAGPPVSATAWPARLTYLGTLADGLVDIARTLAAERGEGDDADVLVWARATGAAVASHQRDVDVLVPWIGLLDGPLMQLVLDGPEDTTAIRGLLEAHPTATELPDRCEAAMIELEALRSRAASAGSADDEPATRIGDLVAALRSSAAACRALARRLVALRRLSHELFDAMDFEFLFDRTRKIFSIGYRVNDGSPDPAAYDLLASEARLASFIAIAKGDVPASHWFRLARPMTPVELSAALVSWSGSMFEYLMPALVMDAPPDSLLQQTARLVVHRQIAYGATHGVPWGISESAYSLRDLGLTYQYSAFGVPGLGLDRGLGEDLVIAPYATALAAMIDPGAAAHNLLELVRAGGRGSLGFYEALDYTRARLPEGATVAVVRAYMAHHQGMTIVALDDVLRGGVMRSRFHAEPIVQATELLLQERAPHSVVVTRPRGDEVRAPAHVRDIVQPVSRRFTSPHTPTPRTHLLSNGRYVVMLTAAGSGYSQCAGLAVTRWREDATRDHWGSYVFLRDVQSGAVWSATYQPIATEPDSYQATFFEDRAEFRRRDGSFSTTLDVLVSPEDDAEIRRVTVTNLGTRPREVEITSYGELVLAPAAADAAHPAFSNLFVQTEVLPALDTLLATRRPRAPDDLRVWAAHVAAVEGQREGGAEYETDRGRFLGRNRHTRSPLSIVDGRPLSNTTGAVLDPVFSLRRRVMIAPGDSARIVFSTIVAPSREQVLVLAAKYRDPATFERAAMLAWTRAQVQLHHLGVERDEANLFQLVANRILYSDPSLRPPPDVLRRNAAGPPALWAHRISGDLPIVLVRIDEPEDVGIVRQLLRAHEYWRLKGLAVDLVILNEKATSYAQELQGALEALVRTSQSGGRHEQATPGNVFILRADLLTAKDRDLLRIAARAVLLSRHGTLADQVMRTERSALTVAPPRRVRREARPPTPPARPALEFFNGLGGFAADGREYVIVLGEGQSTPAPWINVVANDGFGFQVSESGAGYTWAGNSRENQLTQWSNDPVGDPSGESFYVRDDEADVLWGPTALPIRTSWAPYTARHGQGYSRFEHTSNGIALDLVQFVPREDPVKISWLRIENRSDRPRRLTITGYVEWVLGVARGSGGPFIITELDESTGAIFARNPWNVDFGERVAFADLAGRQTAWTCDRREVLGRHGSPEHPAALEQGSRLSGKAGAGLDPCAALQTTIELPAGGRSDVVLLLGQATTREAARALVTRYRAADLDRTLREATQHWDDLLGTVHIRTPDRPMDLLVNRWLLYQTLGCRLWARSAFYQAGGAYGFRDQLQDGMALTVARPEVTRAHLLRAAARQFGEGDVQHWWHPPSGRGVRTRISDDLVWLPFAVARYLEVTEDRAVLDEAIPFLEGALLEPAQPESYFQPRVSEQRASLFEHCARALDRSLEVGAHGLPLIGTGDWNDGMNHVGSGGRGESVWLGWFLYRTLLDLAPWAEARGEQARAGRWRGHARALQSALEAEGWDGDWYRRAYFDDGTPLGSAASVECRIDAIAQSWAVLSAAAAPTRAARAMASVDALLVQRDPPLVRLFAPPFDHTPLDPGYVKGYPPGIRENGGQYTHAAIWSAMAFAALGDGDKAMELFAILNPINRSSTRANISRYKVEPYAMAADVYAEAPHVGRGGWTWYTGSAAWMYRAALESILGFRVRGATLRLDPCIPRTWRSYEITFRYRSARYLIRVENPGGVMRGISTLLVDGVRSTPTHVEVPLADDGATHHVRVELGSAPQPDASE